MNAIGLAVTRPVNDWCAERPTCRRLGPGSAPAAIRRARRSPRAGTTGARSTRRCTPAHRPQRLDGRDVQLDRARPAACPGRRRIPRGRVGARTAQYTVAGRRSRSTSRTATSCYLDQLEIYLRGDENAPRPACCPPPFDVANNWMTEYPTAYVIPLGAASAATPRRTASSSGCSTTASRSAQLNSRLTYGAQTFEQGSYVVWMTQAHRGLANTALGDRRRHLAGDQPAVRAAGRVEPRLPVGRRHRHDPARTPRFAPAHARGRRSRRS